MPFEQRAKLIDKYHSKSQKSKSNNILNEITVGSFVSLKSLPLYNIGTVALTVKDGQPRIGQLNEHVFALRDSKSYKFKIKNTDYFKDAYFNNNINNNSNKDIEIKSYQDALYKTTIGNIVSSNYKK